jgi:hypothetical protein
LAVAPFTHPQGDVYYQHSRLQEDSFAKQYPRYTYGKGHKTRQTLQRILLHSAKKKVVDTAGRTNGDATCLASLSVHFQTGCQKFGFFATTHINLLNFLHVLFSTCQHSAFVSFCKLTNQEAIQQFRQFSAASFATRKFFFATHFALILACITIQSYDLEVG